MEKPMDPDPSQTEMTTKTRTEFVERQIWIQLPRQKQWSGDGE